MWNDVPLWLENQACDQNIFIWILKWVGKIWMSKRSRIVWLYWEAPGLLQILIHVYFLAVHPAVICNVLIYLILCIWDEVTFSMW